MSSLHELEKYEIDVQALMRGIVHELRNPLSAILTATNLLGGDNGLEEESAMLLEVVQKEAKRMNRILTEFSQFARPSAPNLADFDLSQLIREVVAEIKNEGLLGKHIELANQITSDIQVKADPHQIQQALRNILENSAEALERGGTIVLSAVQNPDTTQIIVEDNGGGAPKEVLSQVFQPFFSTKPAATGLGLPIARMALRASGGDIRLENVGASPETPTGVRAILEFPTPES